MANSNKVLVLDLNAENVKKTIKDLRKEMKALKDEMVNMEEGSDEFLATAEKAGELRHQLSEINQVVGALSSDFGDRMKNIGKSITGVIGGVQALKGSMTLLGVENENVTKAIEKMQASMAVIQGIQAIDDGIKSFKNLTTEIKTATKGLGDFKKALIATGLGALVALIAGLVANWDEFSQSLGISAEKMDKVKDAINGVVSVIKGELIGYAKLVINYFKTIGNMGVDVFKGIANAVKHLVKGEFKEAGKSITNIGSSIKSTLKESWNETKQITSEMANVSKMYEEGYTKRTKEEAAKRAEERAEEAKKMREAWEKEYDALLKKYKDYGKSEEQIENERYERERKIAKGNKALLEKIEKQHQINLENIRKEANNESTNKEVVAEQLKNAKLKEEIIKNYQNGVINKEEYDKQIKALDVEYEIWYAELLKKRLDTEKLSDEERLKLYNDFLAAKQKANPIEGKTITENETTTTGDTLSKQISSALDSMQGSLSELSTNPAWGNIVKNISELAKNWDGLKEKFKGDSKEVASAVFGVASAVFNSISQMMTSLSDAQDASTEEGFERQKKLQVAGAVMSMLGGIVSAWSSSMQLPFPANVIVGSTLSTMMSALGAVEIANIKKQKLEGGTSTSSSNNGSNLGLSSSVLNTLTQQQATPSFITGGKTDNEINPIVSVAEIDRVRSRVRVVENETVF